MASVHTAPPGAGKRGDPGLAAALDPTLTAPFELGIGPGACLLVHGFTGTPWDVRPLGEALAAGGFRVRGIPLPGHGATPRGQPEGRGGGRAGRLRGKRGRVSRTESGSGGPLHGGTPGRGTCRQARRPRPGRG